jgi:hypothetical protein
MRTSLLFASLSFALGLFASACGTTGTPTCSVATCAGCCSTDGQCLDGTANNACGTAGLNCDVCSGGQVCTEKRCVMPPPVEPPDAGQPIIAPVETWTWQDFPNSACGNGVPTGVAVNISTRTRDVFLYLQGGGACWNGLTCGVIKSASNVDTGYTSASFAGDGTKNAPPFSRTNAANPLKDMSFVYVPYCTGDVHAGDAVQVYDVPNGPQMTVHHKGGKNMDAFLVRLKDTFPDAQRIFLSGSSAGAYGAQLNYERVAKAWPNAEVHVLADCGQMVTPNGTLLADWLAMWNFAIPSDCTDCTTDFTKYPAYLAQKYPTRRFGLLAYTQDQVLRQFFGYDPATFQQKTEALLTGVYDGRANAKYFLVASQEHVMLDNLLTLTGPGNVPLVTWTSQWLSGDAAWANVKP